MPVLLKILCLDPFRPVSDLPERLTYVPYVYTPVPVDPNPESVVAFPNPNWTDGNTINPEDGEAGYPNFPAGTGTISGTSGADVLTATAQHLIVYDRGGADRVYGTHGANALYGGVGADVIYGRGGND
jgi:hypothetical protein